MSTPDRIINLSAHPRGMDAYSRERELIPRLISKATDSYCRTNAKSQEVKINTAGSYDIVTDADERAQDIVLKGLAEMFPEDRIIAEEGRDEPLTDARTWILDPIDGTLNYDRGVPVFGTQIVLMLDKQPVFSVISLPALNEEYIADRENGAFLNGKKLPPLRSRPLKECIVSTGDFSRRKVFWRQKHEELIGRMRDEVARIRMFGAACSDFAFLASGKTDIHIRFVNKLWDFMPGMFLAEVAGAYYDRELLESTGLLVMCGSESEYLEFKEKVLDGMTLTE